ncbi:ion transporter [Aquisediminimonas sediminicola]|uniref:ion transporter n=1 Tax=Alteraquisediminimonas sediminicola TaxID=2676787 RepID=UPI001C8DCAF7|nr:ion transporter [Aquisediminimonas sediminicola]
MNQTLPYSNLEYGEPHAGWRRKVYQVVFESDTRAGVLFDKALIVAIVTSILTVVMDSVPALHARWAGMFTVLEWFFTLLFTVEYGMRVLCLRRPMKYAGSFYGIVDLLAVLPTYTALLFPVIHVLIDVRVIRLVRIFRIFKLTAYIGEFQLLSGAMIASARKITVFLSIVIMVVVVMGSVMYVVEGPANGFTSIPTSIYWAITTMTTVGFGDIAPKTELGRLISSMMMLVGWGTLAVPTGIVTTELAFRRQSGQPCPTCGADTRHFSANFCSNCGNAFRSS